MTEYLHLVVGCWVALGIKPEPTRRPVDGHLSARPLSSPCPNTCLQEYGHAGGQAGLTSPSQTLDHRPVPRAPETAEVTSSTLGPRNAQIVTRDADPRTTAAHDRRRENFDRHAYVVIAFVAGG